MTVTQPSIKVLVDWTNNPLGSGASAGTDFTDISSYVRLDQGVTITRGRQDNISSVQPGRCTFTVVNDDGRFTPGYSGSPYAPGVILGRRVQVSVKDENGVYQVRFDGMISEFDVVDTPTGTDTLMRVICADVLAFLNRFPAFSCWTVQECNSVAQPALQYVMNEPANSTGLFDSSGNGGPLLSQYTYSSPPFGTIPHGTNNTYLSAPAVTFQSGNSPVEGGVPPTVYPGNYANPVTSPISSPLPSVEFGMTLNNATGANTQAQLAPSSQFQGFLSTPIQSGTSGFTLLGWVWPNGDIICNPYNSVTHTIMSLGNTQTGSRLALEGAAKAGVATYRASYYKTYNGGRSSTSGFSTGTYIIGNAPFMVAVVVKGSTATFYLGGNLYGIGSTLLTAATTVTVPSAAAFNYLSIGGPLGGGNGFIGNISLVNVYDTALTSSQLNDLQAFGSAGPNNTFPGVAFSKVASGYAGVPDYWLGTVDGGLSVLDYADITSSNPSAVLLQLQNVELGLMFVDSAGRLNFHDRSRRMGVSAPTVTLPAGSYNTGIQPKINSQYLLNYQALQSLRGGTGVVAFNQDSVDEYGTYGQGTVAAPITAPFQTWAGNYTQRQVSAPATTHTVPVFGSGNIADAASWNVNTLAEPAMKLATPTVDMLANKTGQNEHVAPSTLYGIEINNVITIGHNLNWWPNGPESSELFIEGVTESYSNKEASIGFYTSPAFQARGWLPGDSTYGMLDVNARVGISDQATPAPLVAVYNPPINTFSTTMNQGAGQTGFVGSRDMLGLYGNLQQQVKPPLLYTRQVLTAQTLPNNLATFIVWDSTVIDTVQAMNQYTNGSNSCIIIVPGWYEVCATVNFAANATGRREVFIVQNQTGSLRAIAPAAVRGTASSPTGVSTSAVFWCGQGDAIAVKAYQDSGGALNTSLTFGGSHLSLRFLGSGSNRN